MSGIGPVQTNNPPPCPFLDLESELIQRIATFLSRIDIRALGLSCRGLGNIVLAPDAEPWKEMRQRLQIPKRDGLTPKAAVQAYFRLKSLTTAYFTDSNLAPEVLDKELEILQNTVKAADLARIQTVIQRGRITDANRGKLVVTAAEGGQLPILEAVLQSGSIPLEDRIVAITRAAKGKHFTTVLTVFGNTEFTEENLSDFVENAGNDGYLDMLPALPLPFFGQAVVVASRHGNVPVLQELFRRPKIDTYRFDALLAAAEKGHFLAVQTLLELHRYYTNNISAAFEKAEQGGHLRILKALVAVRDISIYNLRGTLSVLEAAIEKKDLRLVQFLLRYCTYDVKVLMLLTQIMIRERKILMAKALLQNIFKSIQFKTSNDPEKSEFIIALVKSGNLQILTWALDSLQYFHANNIGNGIETAIRERNLPMIVAFVQKEDRLPFNSREILTGAIKSGDLEIFTCVIQALSFDLRIVKDSMITLIEARNLPLLQVIFQKKGALIHDGREVLIAAIKSGDLEILSYVVQAFQFFSNQLLEGIKITIAERQFALFKFLFKKAIPIGEREALEIFTPLIQISEIPTLLWMMKLLIISEEFVDDLITLAQRMQSSDATQIFKDYRRKYFYLGCPII